MERRIIEKNRRSHMKELYSKLYSLLPTYNPKEALPVPEQVDEAVKYIKSLQERIEKSKEKKENLLCKKRCRSSTIISTEENNEITSSSSREPQLEIQEMEPSIDVILIIGMDKKSTFYRILRFLSEEGFEVVNASFSSSGNSMLHVAHAEVGKSRVSIRATTVEKRLRELINNINQQSDKLELSVEDLWDFPIEPHLLDFEIS